MAMKLVSQVRALAPGLPGAYGQEFHEALASAQIDQLTVLAVGADRRVRSLGTITVGAPEGSPTHLFVDSQGISPNSGGEVFRPRLPLVNPNLEAPQL